MDEKPSEQSAGVSGDAFHQDAGYQDAGYQDADEWVPPADDPLFGPLRALPSSIRRPAWTPAAESFITPRATAGTADPAVGAVDTAIEAGDTASTPTPSPDEQEPPAGSEVPGEPESSAAPEPPTPTPTYYSILEPVAAPSSSGELPTPEAPASQGAVRSQDHPATPVTGTAPHDVNPWASCPGPTVSQHAEPDETSTGVAPAEASADTDDHDRSPGRGDSGVTRGYSTRLIAVAGTIAAAVIAAVAITATNDSHRRPGNPSTAATTAAVAGPDFIDSARTDSDPVTDKEFFSSPRITLDLHPYTRLAYQLDSSCAGFTGDLQAALSASRCRQLIRAVYLSEPDTSGRRVLAAAAVLVSDDRNTAQNAATLITAGKGGVPALPLPAGALPDATITSPTGDNSWRAAAVSGHYLIVLQLAYTDGSEGAATDPALSTARRDLSTLASEPISRRLLTGHGPR
ncbi:hypothetical protein [Frankia sp. Cppng1_Ct_nod]|uniref:hypothetical protein n=1 Tax=Frankia sp. Cppng1_Ct_nod TaxID=2897162 RepID=UPI00202595F0|nr:hypothetical protein [Frankia sp. Cppng1_Ct_nod]